MERDVEKLLEQVRENRRAKGLHVEPTDEQIFQIWEIVLWGARTF